MRQETDSTSTHEDSPSQKVQKAKEEEQTATEGLSSPAIDRAGLVPTRSMMDDDEPENDIEDRFEDEKNTSILDDDVVQHDGVPPRPAQRSSSIHSVQFDETNEWENTTVQQASCPACQDTLKFTTGCEDQLAEQFQFVSACRHPRDFLTIFQDHADSFDGAEHAVAGFYFIPKDCEYCGAASTKFCPSHCTRPKSFFHRKRPPFCSPGETWDSKTDIEIVLNNNKDEKVEVDVGRSPLRSLFLFGR